MSELKRVAVVRLDALGDTLLSTPAIEVLCRELGMENVLVLASQGLGVIFRDGPVCREIAPSDSEEVISTAIDEFGATSVYVFSEKRRALRGAFLSQAAVRIGFDPGWTQPLRSFEIRRYLTERFPIVNTLDSSSRYHEVERYCRLVAKGLSKKSVNGGRLRLFPLERPVQAHQEGPVAFQWARKWLREGWPEQLLEELVKRLEPQAKIFVTAEEKDWALQCLPSDRHDHLVCCPDLIDYARELSTCRYLISIDTGAVHVASAMGVPVLDVFPESGNHHTVPRWRPWMNPHQVVLKPDYQGEQSLQTLLSMVDEARSELENIVCAKV